MGIKYIPKEYTNGMEQRRKWKPNEEFAAPISQLSMQHTMEAHRVVRRRGSHIFFRQSFTDGGEVVSLTHRQPFIPGRFLVLISVRGYVDPQSHGAAGRIRPIEKSNDLIGNRNCELPACSIVPQPTTLRRAPPTA
jgi:hypothetical protein